MHGRERKGVPDDSYSVLKGPLHQDCTKFEFMTCDCTTFEFVTCDCTKFEFVTCHCAKFEFVTCQTMTNSNTMSHNQTWCSPVFSFCMCLCVCVFVCGKKK